MEDKNTITYMEDILVDIDNNYYLFKKSVDYVWAKFMQAGKISKKSIDMFFNNPNSTLMGEQLTYKNVDQMWALLTELPYNKVIWWTKSLSICSIITDVTPKKYLMYYFDIIFAIHFLIGH